MTEELLPVSVTKERRMHSDFYVVVCDYYLELHSILHNIYESVEILKKKINMAFGISQCQSWLVLPVDI